MCLTLARPQARGRGGIEQGLARPGGVHGHLCVTLTRVTGECLTLTRVYLTLTGVSNTHESVSCNHGTVSNTRETAGTWAERRPASACTTGRCAWAPVSNTHESVSCTHGSVSNTRDSVSNTRRRVSNTRNSVSNRHDNASNTRESVSNTRERVSNTPLPAGTWAGRRPARACTTGRGSSWRTSCAARPRLPPRTPCKGVATPL